MRDRLLLGGAVLLFGLLLLAPRVARAWDPAATHSGLTDRAIAASKLHATLVQQLGRPLGGFEPLRLDTAALDPNIARPLVARLARFDPAGGYRPSPEGVAMAAAWVKAGAVLEKTPPERGRHHFFEPGQRAGLDDAPGLSGTWHAARLALGDGATVRETATGVSFTLEGMPALDWIRAPENDLGLPRFWNHWTGAVSGKRPADRDNELVRALLALGGTLAVLEDMGQPAFVRNDFRGDLLASEAGSAYERFVADRYGAVALPPSAPPFARPDVNSYFAAADGQGLAQRTQAMFFSAGTVPADVRLVRAEPSADLERLVNQRLPFPSPAVRDLDLRAGEQTRYLLRDGVRVLAYERRGSQLHFFLDQAVYADCARHWLPVVESYAAGLVDHLLRARLVLALDGGQVSLALHGVSGRLAPGTLVHVFAEDGTGARKEVRQVGIRPDTVLTVTPPVGARKLAAYLRGQDAAGSFVAVGEISLP
jgi:hypothetical protein